MEMIGHDDEGVDGDLVVFDTVPEGFKDDVFMFIILKQWQPIEVGGGEKLGMVAEAVIHVVSWFYCHVGQATNMGGLCVAAGGFYVIV